MPAYDLNLLVALPALLPEESVAGPARRLRVSEWAMSRTLSRIRETFSDAILVRAGRSLVPTPRAIELRERVSLLIEKTQAMLHDPFTFDPPVLQRTFTIRANEGFVLQFGGGLLQKIAVEAPKVGLGFTVKTEKDVRALREAQIDLNIGVLSHAGPEIRMLTLLHDRFVDVTRLDHQLTSGEV
ncbi:LysR family transcriptional regulator [Shinella oryzae]|uniref:LysR family transcriptional regulator n=1 Tax=Shinella oryzae TaxID=2871820 RepID=A0ABY9KDL5_9HYPH|nr:LysR family transcriptional regulator [Shinella oryzae]WLS04956.1 LysR family transcriptional regulator [Shinella oryzae]